MNWKWNPDNGLVKLIMRLFSKQHKKEASVSRLTPSGTPGRPMMAVPSSPPTKAAPPAVIPETDPYRACDMCGYSAVDNASISRAKAEVYVSKGSLYLCGHHFHVNLSHILEHSYYFRTLNYGTS